MKDIYEAIEVVQQLNQKLYETCRELNYSFLFNTDGYVHEITFGEFGLWISDEEERVFNEGTQIYEPLMEYVVREFNKLTDTFVSLKIS